MAPPTEDRWHIWIDRGGTFTDVVARRRLSLPGRGEASRRSGRGISGVSEPRHRRRMGRLRAHPRSRHRPRAPFPRPGPLSSHRYLAGLARAIEASGGRLHGDTAYISHRETGEGVEIMTERGRSEERR